MVGKTARDTLAAARRLADAATGAVERAIEAVAKLTDGGKAIDDQQVRAERIAQRATEARAARELVAYGERRASAGRPDELAQAQALAYAAEVAHALRGEAEADPAAFPPDPALDEAELRDLVRAGLAEAHVRSIGERVLAARGAHGTELDDPVATLTRDSARDFAKTEVVPIAQEMHRQDHLVPEALIQKMAGLGLFGSSVPESHGGTEMGYLTMVVLTEELAAASLVAGSLITRSEILTRALVQGGTEEQRQLWLPRIASGELIVGICVTEPDVGSDVASVQCRATRGDLDGREGWLIDGAKAWSTFAGRANILALLARTDAGAGVRGLSLFIVEKDAFDGHHFQQSQPGGGSITGTANPTPGYRGMHSFTLAFDRYFVPAENLVGGGEGLNRGFYLQMGGFAAGRLQTGGRATGVGQASLEKACAYALDRRQFDRPIAEYQLTQHKIGRMATHVAAGRHLTYAAAREMAEDESASGGMAPAMCKLFASDVAVWVSQEAQLIHGGWGYSEEDPVARYVVDALVLPIFEGVKPILELKIIARQLLAGGA